MSGETPSDVTPKEGASSSAQDVTLDNSNILMESTSSLDKLQKYLPTGTWVMYTALQTWAFSLKPGNNPTSADSNCNSHQRTALIIVLSLSASLAFLSCFVKRFVYDSDHHVSFPAPDFFNVAQKFWDPVTKTTFPYVLKEDGEERFSWPLVNNSGELKSNGPLLAVLVFKPGVKIYVRRKMWLKRMWDWCFKPKEQSMNTDTDGGTTMGLERINVTTVVKIATTVPTLEPRWKYTIVGSSSSKAYLDLSASVWPHAIVSVIAFFTLALFSTQVANCIYPSIPDYLAPTVQTGLLIILSLIAILFIGDDAISMGQSSMSQRKPPQVSISGDGRMEQIPAYLWGVFEELQQWGGRPDGTQAK